MCVIIIKEGSQAKPSREFLQKAWKHNPDGAGFMYPNNGNVIISKGYMDFEKFWKAVKNLPEDRAIVYHFRIATHGARNEKGTHPFPITNNDALLQKKHVITNIGVAHNGIISMCGSYPVDRNPYNLSDTQLYIRDYLSIIRKYDNKFYEKPFWLDVIDKTINSKMAFLLPNNKVVKVGSFVDVKGYSCSNSHFDYTPTTYYRGLGYCHGYSLWDDEDTCAYPSSVKYEVVNDNLEVLIYDKLKDNWDIITNFDKVEISSNNNVFIDNRFSNNIELYDYDGNKLTYDDIVNMNEIMLIDDEEEFEEEVLPEPEEKIEVKDNAIVKLLK